MKKMDTYKDANAAVKGAKKRKEPTVTFTLAVSKAKPVKKMAKGGKSK